MKLEKPHQSLRIPRRFHGVVVAHLTLRHRFAQRFTGSILIDGFWDYDRFFDGTIPNDPRLHFNAGLTFRGGWQVGGSVLIESFMYPAELYTDYAIERTLGVTVDTVPFVGTERLYNLDFAVSTYFAAV